VGDSVAQWLASPLVARKLKGSTLISAALQLPREARPSEQLTTVISLVFTTSIAGKAKQVWFIAFWINARVAVKLCDPFKTRAIPECFCD